MDMAYSDSDLPAAAEVNAYGRNSDGWVNSLLVVQGIIVLVVCPLKQLPPAFS